MDCPDSEILEYIRDDGVVAGKKFGSAKMVNTSPQKANLPQSVKAGYRRCRVHLDIPNPRCCFHCQRFGHNFRSCRGKFTCVKCADIEHDCEGRAKDVRCVKCGGEHAS